MIDTPRRRCIMQSQSQESEWYAGCLAACIHPVIQAAKRLNAVWFTIKTGGTREA